MGMVSHWLTVSLFLLIHETLSEPLIYDGSSTVTISGQIDWSLKYPLKLCKDQNWTKTMNVDARATTAEGDLVMAFGTVTEYFALVIAYDNGVSVGGGLPIGAGFIAPQPGLKLFNVTSLEAQYATSNNFRTTLIPSGNIAEWQRLAVASNQMSENNRALILDISGDRMTGTTQLTITKGNVVRNVQYSSTWAMEDDVYFYMGLDSAHERFQVSKIQSTDGCNQLTFAPSLEPTHEPTSEPTSIAAPFINCDESSDAEVCGRYPKDENIAKTCADVYGLDTDSSRSSMNNISPFVWLCVFIAIFILLLLISECIRFYMEKKLIIFMAIGRTLHMLFYFLVLFWCLLATFYGINQLYKLEYSNFWCDESSNLTVEAIHEQNRDSQCLAGDLDSCSSTNAILNFYKLRSEDITHLMISKEDINSETVTYAVFFFLLSLGFLFIFMLHLSKLCAKEKNINQNECDEDEQEQKQAQNEEMGDKDGEMDNKSIQRMDKVVAFGKRLNRFRLLYFEIDSSIYVFIFVFGKYFSIIAQIGFLFSLGGTTWAHVLFNAEKDVILAELPSNIVILSIVIFLECFIMSMLWIFYAAIPHIFYGIPFKFIKLPFDVIFGAIYSLYPIVIHGTLKGLGLFQFKSFGQFFGPFVAMTFMIWKLHKALANTRMLAKTGTLDTRFIVADEDKIEEEIATIDSDTDGNKNKADLNEKVHPQKLKKEVKKKSKYKAIWSVNSFQDTDIYKSRRVLPKYKKAERQKAKEKQLNEAREKVRKLKEERARAKSDKNEEKTYTQIEMNKIPQTPENTSGKNTNTENNEAETTENAENETVESAENVVSKSEETKNDSDTNNETTEITQDIENDNDEFEDVIILNYSKVKGIQYGRGDTEWNSFIFHTEKEDTKNKLERLNFSEDEMKKIFCCDILRRVFIILFGLFLFCIGLLIVIFVNIDINHSVDFCLQIDDLSDADFDLIAQHPDLSIYENVCRFKVYELFAEYPCNCRLFNAYLTETDNICIMKDNFDNNVTIINTNDIIRESLRKWTMLERFLIGPPGVDVSDPRSCIVHGIGTRIHLNDSDLFNAKYMQVMVMQGIHVSSISYHIKNYINLVALFIRGVNFEGDSIPFDSIGSLPLKALELDTLPETTFDIFPKGFCKLKDTLIHLKIFWTTLTNLDECILDFTRLEYIKLGNNRIATIPWEILQSNTLQQASFHSNSITGGDLSDDIIIASNINEISFLWNPFCDDVASYTTNTEIIAACHSLCKYSYNSLFCDNNRVGDGICDDVCNNPQCGFDGGDCIQLCDFNQCNISSIGDRICNPECNSYDCGWDGGDCDNVVCTGPRCLWIEIDDGLCQTYCMTSNCSNYEYNADCESCSSSCEAIYAAFKRISQHDEIIDADDWCIPEIWSMVESHLAKGHQSITNCTFFRGNTQFDVNGNDLIGFREFIVLFGYDMNPDRDRLWDIDCSMCMDNKTLYSV